MAVCTSMHADTKASNTYLIRFADGNVFLRVDRNLHCNCNGDPFSTPPSYGASGTPYNLQPLQILGLDQLWSLERETQEYNISRLVACVD